jgi:hypothetical protein
MQAYGYHANELLHIGAMIAEVERIWCDEPVEEFMTLLAAQPEYWRRRIATLMAYPGATRDDMVRAKVLLPPVSH